MVLDVVGAVLQTAVALGHVRHEQVLNQTLGVLVEVARELDLALENLLIDGHGVVVVEGVDACVHFVGEDAERPPVDGLSVALVQQHLRRKIFGRPAKRVGSRFAVLRETEIRKFQVPLVVDQNVFWLQVSVDNVLSVQVLEHQADLGSVKSIYCKFKVGITGIALRIICLRSLSK